MRKTVWLSLVVIIVLLTACTSAVRPAAEPTTDGGDVFLIALPRIVIDVDQQGNPLLFGINLTDLAPLLGMDPAAMRVPQNLVTQMQTAGVQHVEVLQRGDALIPLVNAQQVPFITWSDDALLRAMDLAGAFGVQNTALYKQFVPMLRRLGLDVVVRFARADGVEEIALADLNQVIQPPAVVEAEPSVIVAAEVRYDEQGSPSILGISAADLAELGINLPASLPPTMLQQLQQNNIQAVEVSIKPAGLTIYVNGEPLPQVVWSEEILKSVAGLYLRAAPGTIPPDLVEQGVPVITRSNVNLLIHFPVAQGQQPIQVQMHN